jgi:4,5-DOPA dioxygenase extradiol
MENDMLPTLFVSHGAPYLPIVPSPARDFLTDLGTALERPKAILVVSAHWETETPAVNAVEVNETIHDFRGFPAELYALQYPAPGSPPLAKRIAELLKTAGLDATIDRQRGLDHGAWVPLLLAYPKAVIPVLQVSIQPHLGPDHHMAVGRALEPLRYDGVLIVGSGSYTHNLREFFHYPAAQEHDPDWVAAFADWFDAALAEGRTADLASYRTLAPFAARNHPTDEHLLPIFVALGAAGPKARGRKLHRSSDRGVLRLDAFEFTQ